MISSKTEYRDYLERDRIALGKSRSGFRYWLEIFFVRDSIFFFQRLLRKTEYVNNCRSGLIGKLHLVWLKYRLRSLSIKLGLSIPINVFGPGLSIAHYGTIVVNVNARVGNNCRIHPSTCIGASGGSSKAPQIGDNCYIAPGVKIYGDIVLGNNVAIAANAAVNKSFIENNILIGGIPAKRIKQIDVPQ